MATTNLNIRIDDNLKKQAETLFSDLGLNMSSAITIFLKSAVAYNGIPFEIKKADGNSAASDAELLAVSKELLDKNKEAYQVLAE